MLLGLVGQNNIWLCHLSINFMLPNHMQSSVVVFHLAGWWNYLSQLQSKNNLMHTLSPLLRENTRRKERGYRERNGVWLGERDNNYTCPRRLREPDHVAMETQVQQKVTRKSIQIELISLLLAPFSSYKGYKAHFHSELHSYYCGADAALIRRNTMFFLCCFFALNDKCWLQ